MRAKCLIQITFQLFLLLHYYFWDHRLCFGAGSNCCCRLFYSFPFSTTVAEQFGRNTEFKTPILGQLARWWFKAFCAGIGLEHPDVTNASRRIKKSEFDNCSSKGIDMTEVVIGYDGIVIANVKSAPSLNLTRKQIFLATAAKVPHRL